MTLLWAQPLWLLSLLPLAGFAFFFRRRTSPRSLRWRLICLALPLLAAACILAAAAGPAWQNSPRSREIVVLLDLSPSTRTSPWRSPAYLRSMLAQHAAARFTIIGFADSPQVLLRAVSLNDSAAWPDYWPTVPGDTSDLAAALRWQDSPTDRRPRWLITDGHLDLSPLAQSATPLALTIAPPLSPDIGIADLRLISPPPNTARGPDIQTRINATGPATFRVRFLRDGRPLTEPLVTIDTPLNTPAARVMTITDPTPLPEHAVLYEVQLASPRGGPLDPWPESDHASILSPPRGPPAILYVTRNPAPAPVTGITRVTPEEFPATLDTLARAQMVVLENIPSGALRPGAPELLDRFVRDTGGGLLIIGSRDSFGPGNYSGTALEALSPLSSTPPERPPQKIIFLLDASGSMGEPVGDQGERKFKFVVEGVHNALDFLRDTDRITAITFGDRVRTLAKGPKSAVAGELTEKLRIIQTSTKPGDGPSGPTHPDSTLSEFAADLAPDTQVIFLTDGLIDDLDVQRWTNLLTASSAKLTIVAPPPKTTGPKVSELAKAASATWLATDDPGQWPTLLRRAVELPLVGQAQTAPADWESASITPLLRGRTQQWIQTWLKPEARLLALSRGPAGREGRPLAAVVRRGLGHVAAVSFADPGGDHVDLIRELITEITPSAGDQRYAATANRRGDAWTLTVEGHDESRFFDNEVITAEVIVPGAREPRRLEFAPAGPGSYEAHLAGAASGFTAIVTRKAGDGSALLARLNPASLPSSEWPATAGSIALPRGIQAERIGLDEVMPTQWRPRDGATPHDLRAALLLLAAGSLLAALWLRRVGG